MNPEWIGLIAALLTTLAYIPQVIKVVRHRDTCSISLGMYAILSLGIAFWCWYGVLIGSPSVIWANGITLVMSLFILVMKIRYG